MEVKTEGTPEQNGGLSPAQEKKKKWFSHHAVKSLAYYKRHGKALTDKRTRLGKMLLATKERLLADAGENVTEGQKVLCEQIAVKLTVLSLIGVYVFNQESIIDSKGELLPVLRNNYLSYSNSLRTDLTAFYQMTENKRGKPEQSYLDLMMIGSATDDETPSQTKQDATGEAINNEHDDTIREDKT